LALNGRSFVGEVPAYRRQAPTKARDVNAYDKTLLEKLRLIYSLDEVEKKSIYNIVDCLISNKKLKDNFSNLAAY
jgi:hypothetical protein